MAGSEIVYFFEPQKDQKNTKWISQKFLKKYSRSCSLSADAEISETRLSGRQFSEI